ncbi:MAG: hypothetical protein WA369_17005 [Candidatus Acidiferrales bacterium]
MGIKPLRLKKAPTVTLVVGAFLLVGIPVRAQSTSTQTNNSTSTQTSAQTNVAAQVNTPDRDNDARQRNVARFDQFLDGHPEIAEQVRRNPSLVDDRDFVHNHPALQDYLRDNPGVRDELRQNPDAFLQQPQHFDNHDNDRGRDTRVTADFTRFMDTHREVAEQLRKDPSLADNPQFVQNHPDLQDYLRDNPGVRDQLRQDPNAFMQREEQFNRMQNVDDRDNRQDLAQFNRFLDSHREIAEQVRKDPSLANNHDFVQNHPALQDYLRDNPGIRDEVRQDPNAFMHQEDRFASTQHWDDRDASNRNKASFREFLESHHDIQADVTKDPSVVKNREYVQNHPELDGYLNAHPGVRDDMMADPNGFVRGTQQFKGDAGAGVSTSGSGSGMSTGTSTGTSAGASTHGSTGSSTGTSTGTSTQNPKPKL